MAKRMLTRTEVVKANELLKLHLVPSEREGFYKYQDEWSDAKIAAELDPTIQATAIGNLRTELFGKLDTTVNIAKEENGRIKDLEKIVSNLVACHEELRLKHNQLAQNLQLNRVIDVKHLVVDKKEKS